MKWRANASFWIPVWAVSTAVCKGSCKNQTRNNADLPSSFDQLFNVLGPDRSILLKYIHRTESGHESLYTCSMCGKSNAQKNNMMIHVESVHFPGMFVYSCKFCPKTLNTKKALYGHVNNYHKWMFKYILDTCRQCVRLSVNTTAISAILICQEWGHWFINIR